MQLHSVVAGDAAVVRADDGEVDMRGPQDNEANGDDDGRNEGCREGRQDVVLGVQPSGRKQQCHARDRVCFWWF